MMGRETILFKLYYQEQSLDLEMRNLRQLLRIEKRCRKDKKEEKKVKK